MVHLRFLPKTLLKNARDVRSFIVPHVHARQDVDIAKTNICAIIPTYAPGPLTYRLAADLVRWNPGIRIYIVDDSTPLAYRDCMRILEEVVEISPGIRVIRTPTNKLKAGALNIALSHLWKDTTYTPDVILTLDDDVVIERTTIRNLVSELMHCQCLGAVCSQCRVLNKNKNLLTRLQGLEYVGFNAIRLADEGFLRGPLVMHGMLTAFRASALKDVGGFTEGHLIEDYEVTTRLKAAGWSVKSARSAPAWTMAPETLSRFWRQRTRWSYGGITVVARASSFSSIFQDIMGHAVFLATLSMVAYLLVSKGDGLVPPEIAALIISLSFAQLGVWYIFQIWLMRLYEERDGYDWLLRLSLIPEFVYGYAMTFALLGSYSFLIFTSAHRVLQKTPLQRVPTVFRIGEQLFRACGYTEGAWGTRIR